MTPATEFARNAIANGLFVSVISFDDSRVALRRSQNIVSVINTVQSISNGGIAVISHCDDVNARGVGYLPFSNATQKG